jgi:N-acetylmuramoyl-L-alanine amidase
VLARTKRMLGLFGGAGLIAAIVVSVIVPRLVVPRLRGRAPHAASSDRGGARAVSVSDDPLRWPSPNATLTPPSPSFPAGFGKRRIFVDAGHGARGNTGNTSCFCVDEQDFTLEAARGLGVRLEATGHFEVRLSREGDVRVEYRDRVDEAARWGAEAFVSLHSDVRGKSDPWAPAPGKSCPMSLSSPGFSVLWSDEGEAAAASRRATLARAVATRMREAGFLAYLGGEYTGLYEGDPQAPGVFVDRHAPGQRIFLLRKPEMPAILIETHHALDPREAERWKDAKTLDAFAAATAAALSDVLGGDGGTHN